MQIRNMLVLLSWLQGVFSQFVPIYTTEVKLVAINPRTLIRNQSVPHEYSLLREG